ncbi:hypothetical protein GE061_014110, partial [Apolygus lucorum]
RTRQRRPVFQNKVLTSPNIPDGLHSLFLNFKPYES